MRTRAGRHALALPLLFSLLLPLLFTAPARADDPPAEEAPAALTKPPRLTHFVPAVTPATLAGRGAVDVILTIDIDEKGKVVKAEIAESGGDEYDAAALSAVKQFEFQPGYAGDKAVPVQITYRYRFKMQPAAPPPEPPKAPDSAAPAAPAPAATETVPFEGTILKKGDRTAVSGATISIENGAAPAEPLTTLSDLAGHFSFPAVPVGARKVRVGGPGLEPSDTSEAFKTGKRLKVTYFVYQKERYTSIVRGRRLVKETVEQTLDVEEIKRIPGTQGDTLKAVQNLPGVARAPFGGGQLIVWGSSPGDTRVYVDDVFIPTLYHFAGLRAVLPSESVASLTFTPGGYGADHGWGLGGVVQVDTARPKTNGYHGFVQLDFIDGSLRVEGPITKTLDFAVSARRSWIDAFLPLFTTNQFQLSPKYYDYQARVHWKASSHDDFDVLFFGSDDSVSVAIKGTNPGTSAAFDSHIFFHRGLARYQHRFDDGGQLNVTASAGYDVPFQVAAQFGNNNLSVDAKTIPYSLRAVLRKPLATFLRFDAGLDFEGSHFDVDAISPITASAAGDSPPPSGGGLGPVLSGSEGAYTHLIAPWAALNFSFFEKKLNIVSAVRLATIEDNGNYVFTVGGMVPPKQLIPNASGGFTNGFFSPEPRLSARYQFVPQFAIKAAIGFYTQAPDPQTLFGPFGNVNAKPENAIHYVAGFDVRPYSSLSISAEGFYKDLRSLIVPNEHSGSPASLNDGIGRVYGAEILVRQELFKGFFGWLSYTLSRSERKDHPDSPDWRLFEYDQTHILTAIASYKFGHGYQFGLRFRYVTGNPYTPNTGGYVNLNGGGYSATTGPIYSGRLGAFQQLDARFDKTWTYNRFTFTLYLDVQNVYNAKNPEGYQYNFNYTQSAPVAGIPFLPDLGFRGDF